jgi:hypothetical protein
MEKYCGKFSTSHHYWKQRVRGLYFPPTLRLNGAVLKQDNLRIHLITLCFECHYL